MSFSQHLHFQGCDLSSAVLLWLYRASDCIRHILQNWWRKVLLHTTFSLRLIPTGDRNFIFKKLQLPAYVWRFSCNARI